MKKISVALILLAMVSGLAWGAVIINGKAVKFDVYNNNGVVLAPVKDLATALGASVVTDAAGNIKISTSSAGGANQIAGVEGSIGQTLFNGVTRLTVTGVESANLDPFGAQPLSGGKFVLVSVEVKNGSKKTKQYGYTIHKMTLVDDKGQLYTTDAMKKDSSWGYMVGITDLVPGGFVKGKYIFEVPTDINPARIVFEPRIEKNEKAFRVNLKEE
jgi:hypothetical protein